MPARSSETQGLRARAGGRRDPRLISVVVPVLDAANTLSDLLRSLRDQDYRGEWELIVADNGSSDASVEIAQRRLGWFYRGRVVEASGRTSAGHARNAGAAHAEGDFLAFTDADDVPQPNWLSGLAQVARHGDLVAGAVDADGLSSELSRSWHSSPPRKRALDGFGFLTFASGTNTGVWTDVFDELGGFDEEMVSGEDIEFSWRAQLSAFSVVAAPGAVVQERLRERVAPLVRQHYRYGTAGPNLYRRFRDAGMPRPRPSQSLRAWGLILCSWPAAALSRRAMGRWALEASLAAGRLDASLRNRVMFV